MKMVSKDILGSKFCFSDSGITMVSHTPKKNNIVILVSSFMDLQEIINGKPSIIHYYTQTKGGTDTFDALCKNHTTHGTSWRGPQRIFWGMLDQAEDPIESSYSRHTAITSQR